MRRPESAFSLLEVMAAIAIVAIVFTTLARVASEGLYSEGLSKRRFEASLLADEAVANLELSAMSGRAPVPGLSEFEEGLYRVTIDVRPFNVFDAVPAVPGPAGPGIPKLASEQTVWANAVKVTVAWPEGFDEGSVTRLTYTVDLPETTGEGLPGAPGGAP